MEDENNQSTPWDVILDDDEEYYDEVYADDLRYGVFDDEE